MIDPLKLNKSDINKEVVRVSRAGNLISKDSILYHTWRIFWVTEDLAHRIKVIRVRESGQSESLITKGSLHPIQSESIETSELNNFIENLNPTHFDYVVAIEDGTLINHFMDFWMYLHYQFYLMEGSDSNIVKESPLFIKSIKNSGNRQCGLLDELKQLFIPRSKNQAIKNFIEGYGAYSLQRVYLLNNDPMETSPLDFSPEELFVVSSGIKPLNYFKQMKDSLTKIHFCDYSPKALDFWRELIETQKKEDLMRIFEKYSPYFLGTSQNAQTATMNVLDHQIKTYFNHEEEFFQEISQMKEKASFHQVDIIQDLDFLKSSRAPYYFWFSNSYERNLTLLQNSVEDHHHEHITRLKKLKSVHQEKIFFNESNYDFRIRSIKNPFALGTQDLPSPPDIVWKEL